MVEAFLIEECTPLKMHITWLRVSSLRPSIKECTPLFRMELSKAAGLLVSHFTVGSCDTESKIRGIAVRNTNPMASTVCNFQSDSGLFF